MEGGLDEEEAFAVAAALAKISGVKKPAELSLVDDEDVAAVAVEAKLSKVGAKKLAQVIAKTKSAPSPKPSDEAEEPSPVAAHLINDFKMNAKVSQCAHISTHMLNFPTHLYIMHLLSLCHTHIQGAFVFPTPNCSCSDYCSRLYVSVRWRRRWLNTWPRRMRWSK